jgi:phosphoserine phosphatase RsbU/P
MTLGSPIQSLLRRGVLILGAVGFALFFLVLPLVHPDSTVDFGSEHQALEGAYAFESDLSEMDEGVVRQSSLHRDADLIRSLQKERSLRSIREGLSSGEFDAVPVYWRRIRWYRADAGDHTRSMVADIRLTQDGRVVGADFTNMRGRSVDLEALRAGGYAPNSTADERVYFRPPPGVEAFEGSGARPRVDAERVARHHLARTAFAGMSLVLDSMVIRQNGRESTAQLTFKSDALPDGRVLTLEADVASSGVLERLALGGVARPEADAVTTGEVVVGPGGREGVGGIVAVIVHGLMVITILLLFFRRLTARMVDLKTALRDAWWGASWMLLASAATVGYQMLTSFESSPLGYVIALLTVTIAAAGAMFLVLISSAVGDSYTRAVSPATLQSLDLFRRFRVLNEPVGHAVVTGVGVAGTILGILVMMLFIPGAGLQIQAEFPHVNSARPFVSSIGHAFWSAAYLGFAAIAVPMGLALRSRTAWATAASVVLLTLMDVAPISLEPLSFGIVASAGVAAVLVAVVRLFDLLTFAVAVSVASIFATLAPGWLAPGVPEVLDVAIIFVLLAAVLIAGFVGIKRGDPAEKRATFIPEYVREIGRQERIERELEIARQVQQSFLPRHLPMVRGLDLAAVCIPATEVGGDYFDFIALDDDRLGVVIGDVSGKGIQAAFYMTLVKGIVQTLATTEADPVKVLTRLNQHFYSNVPRGTFISVIYGIVDMKARTFCFARAGHNPVLIKRGESATFSQPLGMAIGLLDGGRFEASLESHCLSLGPGDVVLLYTDGITEAMDASRRLFGEDRLCGTIEGAPGMTASSLLGEVRQAVETFTAGADQADDMTAVLIRMTEDTAVAGATTLELESLEH